MGKLVTFWSPYPGRAKVTSSLCAIAGAFGMDYPGLTVAISHGKKDTMELEEKLYCVEDENKKRDLYRNSGIAALKLNCRQTMLTSEKIRRSAIPLRMKSLYLYPNAEQEYASDTLTVRLLTKTLKEEFDVVFLDVESGEQEESFTYLSVADLIVVVLPQEPIYLERFLEKEVQCLKNTEYCILFGGYLEDSRYRIRHYQKSKDVQQRIAGVIPMNPGFFDAMSEGKTIEFFLKNQRIEKKEGNYGFIVQTKKAAGYIRKKLLLP